VAPTGSTLFVLGKGKLRKLLEAARNLRSASALNPWTYYCLFGLLARTACAGHAGRGSLRARLRRTDSARFTNQASLLVLALDRVFDTSLATVLDAFETANEGAQLSGLRSIRFDVTMVGVRKSAKTSQGLAVPVATISKRNVPELVVVPAIGFKMPDPLIAALSQPEIQDAIGALRWRTEGRPWQRRASEHLWWRNPDYLIITMRPLPGGWPRCFASDTRGSDWMNHA